MGGVCRVPAVGGLGDDRGSGGRRLSRRRLRRGRRRHVRRSRGADQSRCGRAQARGRGVAEAISGLGLESVRISGEGTLDGDDVLKVGRTAYVGLTVHCPSRRCRTRRGQHLGGGLRPCHRGPGQGDVDRRLQPAVPRPRHPRHPDPPVARAVRGSRLARPGGQVGAASPRGLRPARESRAEAWIEPRATSSPTDPR